MTSSYWNLIRGKMWSSSHLIILVQVHLICLLSCPAVAVNQPLLLMVGMDAFRYDFLDRAQVPNFEGVIGGGVRAKHVKNVFPTKSAPNWYSLVTGLYPESHGVVNNHVYDPQLDCPLPAVGVDQECSDHRFWDQADPVWITNQEQGGRSGVLHFPFGMTIKYHGIKANFTTDPHHPEIKKEKIVDDVVELFANGSINFGIIYFSDVDHACHNHGPESQNATEAVEEMDRIVGYLIDRLKKQNLCDVINILFVADHGQIDVLPSQTIFLNDSVDPSLYFGYQDNPTYSIFPHKDEDIQLIVKDLEKVEHLQVFTKDTMPDKFHYQNNKRIPPILLMADLGWNIAQNRSEKPYWEKTIGEHGYSNDVPQMWPFFVASGPAFRKGITSEPFSSLDIYPLICHILRLEPRPHNGSLENVKHLLADGIPSREPVALRAFVGILLFVVIMLTCLMLLSCRLVLKYKGGTLVKRIEEVEGLLEEDLDN